MRSVFFPKKKLVDRKADAIEKDGKQVLAAKEEELK